MFDCLLKSFIYLFIFGCAGSSLLYLGFLELQRAGATLFAVCEFLVAAAYLMHGL